MGGVFDLLLSSWIWSEFFFSKEKIMVIFVVLRRGV